MGCVFFEGIILSVPDGKLDMGVLSICESSLFASPLFSVWSDDKPTQAEMDQEYSAIEQLDLFKTGKLSILALDYDYIQDGNRLKHRLIIEKWDEQTIVEIICYREPILISADPKKAVASAILEFRRLKELFGGSSLFIGPDTLNYPENDESYPDEWIKVT